MSSGLPSISYASSIVGFTSFAFTFFTFVRVFWEAILTLWSASKDMPNILDNLRTELHGERAYFKYLLRRQSSRQRKSSSGGGHNGGPWGPPGSGVPHADLGPLRLLNDTVKDILHEFRRLEAPFLNSPSSWDKEKDVERSSESMRGDYAPMTLNRRWIWMRRKEDFINMSQVVTRIQTRRIATDVSNGLWKIHAVERQMRDIDDRLWDLEENLVGEKLSDGNVYVKRRVVDRDRDRDRESRTTD